MEKNVLWKMNNEIGTMKNYYFKMDDIKWTMENGKLKLIMDAEIKLHL